MENKVFEQLMLADGNKEMLSAEQENFITTHRRIISCGNAAGRAFIDLARELQRMRDGKLYVAAGFADFGEYVEQAVGLKCGRRTITSKLPNGLRTSTLKNTRATV